MTTTVNINSALKINVTPIESGASGGVLFHKSDGKLGQSSNLHWDETNSRLSIGQGSSPSARLDVLAQGVLSTDLAFRVRNSGNTANIFQITGNGRVSSSGIGNISSNTAFGELIFSSTVTGVDCCAFGNSALGSLTSGFNNSAFGSNCLIANTTGFNNSGFGRSALAGVIGAGNNSAFGFFALAGLTSGSGNSSIGRDAGRFIEDGVTANTTGTNGLFLGFSTKAKSNGNTNEIVIGHNAIGNGSNSVTLGNTSITQTNLRGQIVISGFASSPVGVEGAIYYDTVLKKHYGFNGTNWNALY